MKIDLPKGVRVYDKEESYLIDWIEKCIQESFESWGYEKIITPLLEYYEAYSDVLDEDILKNTFRLVDRYEGETLILRPDFTVSIARYIASLQKKEFPIRFYYLGDIFRFVVPKGDKIYEKRQAGIELIGVDQIEADAEVIAVATYSLKKLGIENFQIDINNVKLFKSIVNLLKLSSQESNTLLYYLKNRETYNIKRFLENYNIDKKIKDFIVSLPKLSLRPQGLEELISKYKDIEFIYKPLEELYRIYRILDEYELGNQIVIDLCEPREFNYYTGIVFEIFIKDFSKIVGYGGRYDTLLSKYNGDYPATGFAFDTLAIFEYISNTKPIKHEKDYYIIDTTEDKTLAYKIAKILRDKGFKVTRDIVKRDVDKSLEFAFKNGYKYAILIKVENSEKKIYIFNSNYEEVKQEIFK